MITRTNVIIRTQFEALHAWPNCPIEEVAFLRHPHRHIFHVTVKLPVAHDDRDVEFIVFKRLLEEYLQGQPMDLGSKSCEMLCIDILAKFEGITYVSVFEDNENGAEVIVESVS